MGIKAAWSALRGKEVSNLTAEQIAEAFRDHGPYYNTAGVAVSQDTAWRSSAVYACVRIILGGMTTMPIIIYDESDPMNPEPKYDHPFAPLFNLQPNPLSTALTFWSSFITDKLLGGDGVAIINRMGAAPVGFEWINRKEVTVHYNWELNSADRDKPTRLRYSYTNDKGRQIVKDQDDILHCPNLGYDGKVGMSCIKAGAQGIGLNLASQEYASRFFSNGARPDYVMEFPQKLDKDQAELIIKTMVKKHGGLSNSHTPGVLTQGGKIHQLSINAADAQLLETQKASLEDICRYFGVPPVMVGQMDKTTSWGSGVAEQAAWLVMFNLQAQAESIEQEFNRKLFLRTPYRMRFNFMSLLRGDAETRFKNYDIARGGQDKPGFMTMEEIRSAEGFPQKPKGELYTPRSDENAATN